MKKLLYKSISLAILCVTTQAQAELVSLSYTDTHNNQISTSPNVQFINPTSDIAFSLSAGIERKVRISILNENGDIVASKTSELLGAESRINVDGKEYYGDIISLPTPTEGHYTLKSEILTGQGNSIQSDEYRITIDVTPPVFHGQIRKIGHSSGSIDVITNNGYGDNKYGELVAENVKDELSSVSKTIFFTIDKNNVRKEIPAINDFDKNKTSVLVNNVVNSTLTPYDLSSYNMGFGAYDKAGNYSEISRLINVEKDGNYSKSTEIYNPVEDKWESYKANMVIYENPVRARDVRKTTEHINFNNSDYGWNDKNYNLVEGENLYRNFSFLYPNKGSYLTYITKAGNYKYTRYNEFKFTLAEDVYIPSNPLKLIFKIKGENWSTGNTLRLKSPSIIEKVRIYADTREHNQRASISIKNQYCIIPSGEEYCEIEINHNIDTGSSYTPYTFQVGDEDGKNMLFGGYMYTYWDFDAPEVNMVTYDESSLTIIANVYDKNRRQINSPTMFQTQKFELVVENNNDETIYKENLVEELDIHNYRVTFDTSKIPDGTYKIGVRATDTYDNVSEIKYIDEPLIFDRTAPTLKIVSGDKINKLEEVIIQMSDNHPEGGSFTQIQLSGGSVNEKINLPVRLIGKDTYQLEYPVLFPTLEENERYVLSIVATDPQGNKSTVQKEFLYEPPRINLANGKEKIRIPAVQQEFYTNEGFRALELEPFTLGDGSYFQGHYDVMATLRADSDIPLNFNGIIVNPGETKEIIKGYDFGSLKGKLSIPLQAVETGKAGKATIMVTTTAPNSPMLVVDVETWTANVKLQSSKSEYVQLFDPIKIRANVQSGSGCELTSDLTVAQSADNINKPVCYIEWDNKPVGTIDQINENSGTLPGLSGYISEPGQFPLQYSLYIYQYNGDRTKLDEGQAYVNVLSAQNHLAYSFTDKEPSYLRTVDPIKLSLKQTKGFTCLPTFSETRAIQSTSAFFNGSESAYCLIEWQGLSGLTPSSEFLPDLFGYINEAGNHALNWTVSAFDSKGKKIPLLNQTDEIVVVDPIVPEIFLDSEYLLNDDILVVPHSSKTIGQAQIVSSNTTLKTDIKFNEQVIDEIRTTPYSNAEQFLNRLNIKNIEGSDIQKSTLKIESYYERLPEIKNSRVFDTYLVPGSKVRPSITMEKKAVNTDPYDIHIEMIDASDLKQTYSVQRMGTWKVRLMKQGNLRNPPEPLTEFMDMNNGQLTYTLDDLTLFSGEKSLKVFAEAKLVVPEALAQAGYERIETSNGTDYVQILMGDEIETTLQARKYSGEAPFKTTLSLKVDDRNLASALGDVVWQVREKGSSNWTETNLSSGTRLQFTQTFDIGNYEVRAKVFNKNSGVEKFSEITEVVSYQKIGIEIDGPSSAFVSSTQTYTAKLFSLNKPTVAQQEQIANKEITRFDIPTYLPISNDDQDIEWSIDGGKTYTHKGPTLELSSVEASRYVIAARVKPKEAPADDAYAYENERLSVNFLKIKAPVVRIRANGVVEVNKEFTLKGEAIFPYRNMSGEIKGFFTLPNGDVIEQEEIQYTPTEADFEAGTLEFSYTAWIEGYRDQGAERTAKTRVKTWRYVWPKFVLETKQDVRVAPATSTSTVRAIGFRGKLDEVKYEWVLPENAPVTVNDETRKSVFLADKGNYEIGVIVSDARGNVTELKNLVTLNEPEPYKLVAQPNYSNANMREPLDLRVGSYLRGGHPHDRIARLEYKLNGKVIDKSGLHATAKNLLAGSFDGMVEVETNMGHKLQEKFSFDVIKNMPPVCENLTYKQTIASLLIYAKCSDPDGRIRGYEWVINGNTMTTTSNRHSLNYKEGEPIPSISVIAIDDVGARSASQVLNK